ncbi:MAG: hypothetical protein R5N75_08830 [Cutibacterium granulosum]|uniref:hypothetical protein n=2 Tax=Bacteria TaxID=2 RepID=UPI002B225477|nr:hypothetical protein [Cutibacterium granulosum]MEA5660195.1 hypothetical protein [Cutibacterium granulosum]
MTINVSRLRRRLRRRRARYDPDAFQRLVVTTIFAGMAVFVVLLAIHIIVPRIGDGRADHPEGALTWEHDGWQSSESLQPEQWCATLDKPVTTYLTDGAGTVKTNPTRAALRSEQGDRDLSTVQGVVRVANHIRRDDRAAEVGGFAELYDSSEDLVGTFASDEETRDARVSAFARWDAAVQHVASTCDIETK